MWSWIDDYTWEGDATRAYACTSCFPDYKDLENYLFHRKPLSKRLNDEEEA